MEKYIEISENSFISKVMECLFILGGLSLVLYTIIHSTKPIQNVSASQVGYWVFIAILSGLWLLVFDDVLKTRRFKIMPGTIEVDECRMLVLRYSKFYPRHMVKTVNVERKNGHFLFKQSFAVLLHLNSGKRIKLKVFSMEREAFELCAEVEELLCQHERS